MPELMRDDENYEGLSISMRVGEAGGLTELMVSPLGC